VTTVVAEGTFATVRRGLSLSPELRPGLAGTVALAIVQMAGRIAVPRCCSRPRPAT
jgi:ATP-binding cassette subfamily B protein